MSYVLVNRKNPRWFYSTSEYETNISSKGRLFNTYETAQKFQKKNKLSESYNIKKVDERSLINEVNSSLDKLYDALCEVEARTSNVTGATDLTDELEKLLKKLKKTKVYLYGDFRPSFYSSKGDEYYSSVVPNSDVKSENSNVETTDSDSLGNSSDAADTSE